MFYTLGQAAKATGLSKPTIAESIKKGRISARKNESGVYEIDPAELHRVYAPITLHDSNVNIELGQPITHDLTAKIAILESQIDSLNELKNQIANERDYLRGEHNRLLGVIEEQAKSVKQLTYQPTPVSPVKKPLNYVLIGVSAFVILTGIAVYFYILKV